MKSKRAVAENHCPVPKGTLVIIGGKENKGEEAPVNKQKPADFIRLQVLEEFRKTVAKKEPVIEVITTASSEGDELFKDYQRVFTELGFAQIGQIHHNERKEVLQEELSGRLQNADAFFFSGGDQLKLTAYYGGTPFLQTVKKRYLYEKITIGGTSAGAMAFSTPMIYAGNEDVQELGGAIKITTGLEFLKDVCIDTHFVHRGRFVRMAQVVVTNPTCIGIGIEEDTALVVKNGSEATAVGTGMIIIIEGFNVVQTDLENFTAGKPITARNLNVHLLADQQEYIIPQLNPPHK